MSGQNGYRDDRSRIPSEAELEALLDEQSDEDFGQSEQEVASENQRAVLKEWTAQDFANIYTRFRPHLERHARRFLRNPSQVDEVVQDAFLYLLVTLPELDSELGVLRFLKWKVRLLCLDVIRASGKAYLADIDEHEDLAAEQPEIGSELERAEDTAIVMRALAKIHPRHREVLIASIYEEKSAIEIAGQVGLTENATRQLLLRARNALKKALVGEVDTAGMSLSQILSVAARKAAAEAQEVGVQAMSVLAVAVIGLTALLNFNPFTSEQPVALTSPGEVDQAAEPVLPSGPSVEEAEVISSPVAQTASESSTDLVVGEFELANSLIDRSPFDPWLVDGIFEQAGLAETMAASAGANIYQRTAYAAISRAGFWADFYFDADSETPFQGVRISFLADDVQYFAILVQTDFYVGSENGLDVYTFVGEVQEVTNLSGETFPETRMRGVRVSLEVAADSVAGQVVQSSLLAQSDS